MSLTGQVLEHLVKCHAEYFTILKAASSDGEYLPFFNRDNRLAVQADGIGQCLSGHLVTLKPESPYFVAD